MRKKQQKEEKILEEVRLVVGDSGKFWFLNRIRYLSRRKLMNLSCPWAESGCAAAAPVTPRSWKTDSNKISGRYRLNVRCPVFKLFVVPYVYFQYIYILSNLKM